MDPQNVPRGTAIVQTPMLQHYQQMAESPPVHGDVGELIRVTRQEAREAAFFRGTLKTQLYVLIGLALFQGLATLAAWVLFIVAWQGNWEMFTGI